MGALVNLPAQQSGSSLIAQSLGTGLGHGFQKGLSERLNKMFEQKQNRSSATNLSKQLGLEGQASDNFINFMQNLAPDKQASALRNIAEAQDIYGSQELTRNLFGAGGQDNEMLGGQDNGLFGGQENLPEMQNGIPGAQPETPNAPRNIGPPKKEPIRIRGLTKEQATGLLANKRTAELGKTIIDEINKQEDIENKKIQKIENENREDRIFNKTISAEQGKKFVEKIEKDADAVEKRKLGLIAQENAINSGLTTKDWLAEKFDQPWMLSENAAVFKAGRKSISWEILNVLELGQTFL